MSCIPDKNEHDELMVLLVERMISALDVMLADAERAGLCTGCRYEALAVSMLALYVSEDSPMISPTGERLNLSDLMRYTEDTAEIEVEGSPRSRGQRPTAELIKPRKPNIPAGDMLADLLRNAKNKKH